MNMLLSISARIFGFVGTVFVSLMLVGAVATYPWSFHELISVTVSVLAIPGAIGMLVTGTWFWQLINVRQVKDETGFTK